MGEGTGLTLHLSSPILVIGSAGQLGTAFTERLADSTEMVAVSRAEVDVSNGDALRRLINRTAPSIIINCSAYNDVDGAEMHPDAANQVNGAAVALMAAAARDRSATLVHFSSEFVFDGRNPLPYTENDEPSPISAYGLSKLAGEHHAATTERHYILRLSSVYGGHTRRAYVDRILSQIGSGERVAAFTDRDVSPSYVPEIVDATIALLEAPAPSGIYHCGSSDFGTWYEVGAAIASLFGRFDLLEAASFIPENHRAQRPRHCALSSEKLAVFYRTRTWRDALLHYVGRIGGPAT